MFIPFSEIDSIGVCLNNALEQIDYALDTGDRRAFKRWSRRRAELVTKREQALLAAATAEVPA